MIALATSPEALFYAIVAKQLTKFPVALEETIEHSDKLGRTGTKLLTTREKGIDD